MVVKGSRGRSIAHIVGSCAVVSCVLINLDIRNKDGSRSQCRIQPRPAEAWRFPRFQLLELFTPDVG
jgi:hypothetical protein